MTSLHRFADQIMEDRAAFAVLRALQWDGHTVDMIERPDRQPSNGPGRKVDVLFNLDGEPSALEVVLQTPLDGSVSAAHRLKILEERAKEHATKIMGTGWGSESLLVAFGYRIAGVLELGREQIGRDASRLVEAAVAATTGIQLGTGAPIDFQSSWLRHGQATRVRAERPRLHLLISGPAWFTDGAADAWVAWVVARKGNQHPTGRRAVLAIVQGHQLDPEDLQGALARFGSLPWWRVYLVRLDPDQASLVGPP